MTPDKPADEINWELTTWEGSRREQLRRWAALPLANIIAALEEMESLAQLFGMSPTVSHDESPSCNYHKGASPKN